MNKFTTLHLLTLIPTVVRLCRRCRTTESSTKKDCCWIQWTFESMARLRPTPKKNFYKLYSINLISKYPQYNSWVQIRRDRISSSNDWWRFGPVGIRSAYLNTFRVPKLTRKIYQIQGYYTIILTIIFTIPYLVGTLLWNIFMAL